MDSFAFLYNPFSFQRLYFNETKDLDAVDLTIEDFWKNKMPIYLQRVDSVQWNTMKWQNSTHKTTSKSDFLHYVNYIRQAIKSKSCIKIVAAQTQVSDGESATIDMEQLIETLILQFSNTFVYAYAINGSIWVGASPELIGVLQNQSFKTIAIAGTKNQSKDRFSQKEIEEQKIVTDYIYSCLFDLDSEVNISCQHTVNYGNLQHLVNELSVEMKQSTDFVKIVRRIQPSPAIAGYPKDTALDFIEKNEPIQRDYYCGMSILKLSEDFQMAFAMIRCVQLTQNQQIYYGGAGIVADSDAEKEYDETCQKIQNLKKVVETVFKLA